MAVNKIVYAGEVLIDLTDSNLTEEDGEKIKAGYYAYGKDGKKIEGTNTEDSDTTDATAKDSEILVGKTAYVNKYKVTGTMPNNGGVKGVITNIDTPYNIPVGFHDGSGTVGIDTTEKDKLIPNNIREGVTILGVEGTMSGSEDEHAQDSKSVTPKKSSQTVLPDEGYTCLRQVVVNAIPYTETPNSAGGITVTIATE